MKPSATKIPGLEVELLHEGRAVLVTLTGQIDRVHFDEINELLSSTVKNGCRHLVGDCSRSTYISSTGVGMIGYYAQQMRKNGGEMIMVKPRQGVVRVIELARFEGLVRFFDTREEALAYVEKALGG